LSKHVREILKIRRNEGDPHKVMKSAFVMRLRHLYPDANVKNDRPIHNIPVRPDVYVRHKDRQQWAFEMVHTNTKNLAEKQSTYSEYGINTIWILWDELRPKAGRKYISPHQGILITNSAERPRYKLTPTLQQMLQMQSGPIRRLYTFTVNPFFTGQITSVSAFMQTVLIGVEIYEFADYHNGNRICEADCDFYSLAELKFDDQGHPAKSDTEDIIFDKVIHDMGFDFSSGFLVAELLERVDHLLTTPEQLRQAMILFIAHHLMALSASERLEIIDYMKSGLFQQQMPFISTVSEKELAHAWHDSGVLRTILPDIRRLANAIEQLNAPQSVKVFLNSLINIDGVDSVADFMDWQAKNQTLKRVYQNLPK
jgi:hypothetical protein